MQAAISAYVENMKPVWNSISSGEIFESTVLCELHGEKMRQSVDLFTSRALGDLETVVIPIQNDLVVCKGVPLLFFELII